MELHYIPVKVPNVGFDINLNFKIKKIYAHKCNSQKIY